MKKWFAHYRTLSLMLVIVLSCMIPTLPWSFGNTLAAAVAGNTVNVQSTDAYSNVNPAGNSNPSGQQPSVQETSTMTTAFNDLSSGDSNYPFINYLYSRSLIKGFPDGGYHPHASLTRAEIVTLLVQAAGLSDQVYANAFSDVPESHWAVKNINIAVKAGLIRGYDDGTYRPDQPVSRAEGITLLLNLSKLPDPGNLLPVLNDVTENHWAARSIAMGLASKMVVLSGGQQRFFPDNPFTRSDFSRALAVMLIRNPELAKKALTGELSSLHGSTYLIKAAGAGTLVEITGKARLYPGDSVVTGSDGSAQILFPDGTGILMKENTTVVIKDSQGRSYMLPDGTPGVSVERLRIELKIGKIFGILATRHVNSDSDNVDNAEKTQQKATLHTLAYSGNKTALNKSVYPVRKTAYHPRTYPGNNSPGNNEIKLEKLDYVVESYDQEQAWWETYSEEGERLEVDMPWGTAGIRGTGFGCAVNSEGISLLSILFGSGFLSSNGQTVNLSPGQYSRIIALLTSPTTPNAMTAEQRREWLQLRDWLEERARDIQSKMGTQLEASLSQELQSINTILDLIDQAFNSLDALSTTTITSGGGGGSSYITYSLTYIGNGAGGGSVPLDSTSYISGTTVTVLGNTGEFYKDGCSFGGWNTAADGGGTSYSPGATFNISNNTTLYAVWSPITVTLTYDGNGADGGAVPASAANYTYSYPVIVLDNMGGFTLTGHTFSGWNTAADKSGTSYNPTYTFNITDNTTLYAVWTPISYTLTYDGNDASAGTAPDVSKIYAYGTSVKVLGNTGGFVQGILSFHHWNTHEDNSGQSFNPDDFIPITGDTTLYAIYS